MQCSFLVEYLQVGLIGLVEREWLVTLATISIDEVDYIDFIIEGRRLCSQLRQEVRLQVDIQWKDELNNKSNNFPLLYYRAAIS